MVRELARFREAHAQARNIPRNRVFKDEALVELASNKPQTPEELSRARLLLREARRGEVAEGILAAVRAGLECPGDALPKPDAGREIPQANPALADLLRVLLKAKAAEAGVATRLIASAADLDALAGGVRDIPVLHGWRHEVFGRDAIELCEGRVGLAVKGRSVTTVPL